MKGRIMNKNDMTKAAKWISRQGKILARGFVKTLWGAATAGLFAMAVYCLTMIPSEGGYVAVADFVGAMATLAVAFSGMYAQGMSRKKVR